MTDQSDNSRKQTSQSNTWQQAVHYHNAGQLADAAALYELVLRQDPNSGEANHNYGILQYQLGFIDRAVTHLARAAYNKPTALSCWLAYGEVLLAAGRAAEALTELDNAAHMYGFEDGKFRELHARAREAASLDTKSTFQDALDATIDLYNNGRLDESEAHAQHAVHTWPDEAGAWAVLGAVRSAQGRLNDAINAYRETLARDPEDAETFNNLANALQHIGQYNDAIANHRQALTLQPSTPLFYTNFARTLQLKGQLTQSEQLYRQALQLDPLSRQALGGLMEVLERANRVDALRETVTSAREILGPDDAWVALSESRLALRDRHLSEARQRLETIEDRSNRLGQARAFALASVCDRLGDADAAMAYAEEGNALAAHQYRLMGCNKHRYLEHIDHLRNAVRDAGPQPERVPASEQQRRDPTFIVGFPRSGTTLLDVVLAAHPQVLVADEADAVGQMIDGLSRISDQYPHDLFEYDDETILSLREIYFSYIDEHLKTRNADQSPDVHQHLLIDKLPLNITEVGLIKQVFPNADFLLMLRHPADCVISSYLNNFAANDAMASFLDLTDTATLYDRVMKLWTQYVETLPVDYKSVFYEQLVSDFDTTVVDVLEFVGLSWNQEINDYRQAAQTRPISTPSYQDVAGPLTSAPVERWHRYGRHLEPVWPVIAPWIFHWGYASDV